VVLNIANHSALQLPLDFVTERISFLARTGAGKSGGMRVLFEEMVRSGQFIVYLDPKGDAWGIRAAGDGEGLPVLILGGEHADAPLEPTAGKFVADFLVGNRISTVLDVSEFSEAEMVRFVADFADRFYRTNREAVHWFIDEADEFAPQSGYNAAATKCLGAIQRIARRARGRGIGVTLASQRSAVINKSVLTQTGTLIAMQTTAPHDLKAIDAWLEYAATKEARRQIMEALPGLKPREAYVYSPQFLGTKPRRITFRRFQTFDSMRTPKAGESRQQPKKLADVDLAAVQRDMAATIEEAKQNDPAELRKRIRELERQAGSCGSVVADASATERAVASAVKERDRHWSAELAKAERARMSLAKRLENIARLAVVNGEATVAVQPPPATALASSVAPAREATPRPRTTSPRPMSEHTGDLPKGESRILAALLQFPAGLDRSQLSVLTTYKRSTRDRYVQFLKEKGLAADSGGKIVATDAGAAALPDAEPLPSGRELRDYWMAKLPEGERRILQVLVDRYPASVSRDEISDATGYKRSTRDRYLQYMQAKEIVEATGEGVRAAGGLF
jgi:Helicase HerA, central domain